jgi:CBS domain-containing protein
LWAGSSQAGASCILLGWFLKEASDAHHQRVRLEEGLQGLTVRDAMEDVVSISGSGSVAEAAREYFGRSGYGSYPVVRGEKVVGLLALEDILRLSVEEREATSVQGAMRPLAAVLTADPAAALPATLARMQQARTTRLLAVQGEQLVGMLTMNGVVRRLKIRERLAAV